MKKAILPLMILVILAGCSDSEELARLREENNALKTRVAALEASEAILVNEVQRLARNARSATSVEAEERAADEAIRRTNARARQGLANLGTGPRPNN